MKLREKLREEVEEFLEAESAEEMADVLEIITAWLALKGWTIEKITAIQETKRAKHGGFDKRIVLETIFRIGSPENNTESPASLLDRLVILIGAKDPRIFHRVWDDITTSFWNESSQFGIKNGCSLEQGKLPGRMSSGRIGAERSARSYRPISQRIPSPE